VKLSFTDRRAFLFNNVLFLALVVATLYGCEFVARFFVPAWPAMGLHGVKREKIERAWGTRIAPPSNGLNQWGEFDHEHSKHAVGNNHRVALIGDSFLEVAVSNSIAVQIDALLSNRQTALNVLTYTKLLLGSRGRILTRMGTGLITETGLRLKPLQNTLK